ncbi:hypothetical protein [Wolbachia endosymbiont of Spodoptera picta]|uniref:hypothetical protein n=1 Tax=Wolbachia endosymbiont of Spodoptera picta TaxID=2769078 RepID=UPI001FEB2440|nr:hypothetical protein [Wolbachia endosymbiont of Spodoptera picta]
MTTAKKRKLPSDFHDVEVGIERPRILGQMNVPRKRKSSSGLHGVESPKRFKSFGQEITPLNSNSYPNDFYEGKLSDVVGQSVSDVEQKLSSSQVAKYDTAGDGNCFFHAVFGENSSNVYKTDKAQAMRKEWREFLNQFKSLNDPKMPNALKQHLRTFFVDLLSNTGEVLNVPKEIKELIEEINKKVDDIINESVERTKALKNNIIEKFSEDEKFCNEIYEVIKQATNAYNEHNVQQRDLLSIEDLLKKENEKTLYNRVEEELESCAYRLDTTLTKEKYKEEYIINNDRILDSVIGQKDFYQTYLKAIQKQGYFVFHGEIPILASLSNTEIEAYFEGQEGMTIYKPEPNMINPEYVRKDELWGNKKKEVIYLGGNHYSRARVITKEIQEQEDFQLAKELQLDEILEYCNLSKDISERAEVEKRFDEFLAKNADGKIGDVIGQCINDVQQRIKCLEEPVLSRRCSVEEARVEKTFYQQQVPQPVR